MAAERMQHMRERKRGSLSLQSSSSQPKDQSTTHNKKDMPTDEEKEQKKDRQRRQAAERMRRMRERKRASQPTMPTTSSNKKEHDNTNEEKQKKKKKKKENQQAAEQMRRMRMRQGNLRIYKENKIIVSGAGITETNGKYRYTGLHQNLPYYSMIGKLNGEDVQFHIFRSTKTCYSHDKSRILKKSWSWCISSKTYSRKSKDEFYYSNPKVEPYDNAEVFDMPPEDGWVPIGTTSGTPPKLKYR